jgi:hypothetical protein
MPGALNDRQRSIGTRTVALRVVEFPHASVARYVIV